MKASKAKLVQKNRITHARDQQRCLALFQRQQEARFNRELSGFWVVKKTDVVCKVQCTPASQDIA